MIKSIRDDLINCFVAMFNDRKKADELMAESEGRAFVFDEDYIDKAVAFVCGCQKGEDLFVETKKKIVYYLKKGKEKRKNIIFKKLLPLQVERKLKSMQIY